MKKIIFILAVSLFFTGCSKKIINEHYKSYKMYFNPTKGESTTQCPKLTGTLMIKDSNAVGALHTDAQVSYLINGNYDTDTYELSANITDDKGHIIIIASGDFKSDTGKGTWAGTNCDGNWKAVRDNEN